MRLEFDVRFSYPPAPMLQATRFGFNENLLNANYFSDKCQLLKLMQDVIGGDTKRDMNVQ